MKAAAIIVAAGKSERLGGPLPKQYVSVVGRPLLAWTIEPFERAQSIDTIMLVVASDRIEYVRDKVTEPFDFLKVVEIVAGGEARQRSVLNGLEKLPPDTQLVAIHDGARPLVTPTDIDAVVKAAAAEQAAMLAQQVTDTIKRADEGYVIATLDRTNLYRAQTPQVFKYDLILEAHRRALVDGTVVTDDAALFESSGSRVWIVEPTNSNMKVTTPDDLAVLEALFEERNVD